MKKLLIVLGISAALAVGACETPGQTTDPNGTDTTATSADTTSSATRTDTSTNKPDSMPRP